MARLRQFFHSFLRRGPDYCAASAAPDDAAAPKLTLMGGLPWQRIYCARPCTPSDKIHPNMPDTEEDKQTAIMRPRQIKAAT
jgi:hypothetical protein